MTAFVGRDRELAELMAGFDDAVGGRGRLFLIGGEPGIGKSRLADELQSRARGRGAAVLVGRCWEAGGAPPFWPWVQALRARVRDRDPEAVRSELGGAAHGLAYLIPELGERLPERPGPSSLESEVGRFQLFDAVASFLRSTAQVQPLVVVLDDLHAADEPSLLLLRFVARELAESRVLVVGSYRTVDPMPAGTLAAALAELAREPATRTISLTGFAQDEVARLIELTTAGSSGPGLAKAVHAETEGNPLFVGEIVRLLAAEGRLDEPEPRLAIPQSLKEAIARRLRHLSADCKRVLSLASVLGHEFDPGVLANVGGLERGTLLGLLDEAIAQQLVLEAPATRARLRFAHALFRDGLYDELPPGRRRQLHKEVGEAIERLPGDGEQHLAELAHHFCQAVPSADPGKAVDYARRAGDHAVRLLAPEEAVRLYELALSVADERQRPRLLLSTARSMWMAGATGSDRAVEARDALIAAGDTEGVVEAELLLANIRWHEGRRRLVPEHMQRALAVVRDRPVTRLTAEVLDNAARFHMLAEEREEAISVGREGLAIAEQLGLDSVRAHCLTSVGVSRASLGDLGGLEDLQQAVEVAVAAQDGWAEWRTRVNLADCLLWRVGDADRAFAERHELRGLLQTAGSWPLARWNRSYDAWESYWRGSWEETLRICSEFIEQVEAGEPHYTAPELYSLRALVRVSRSDKGALGDARAAVTLGRRSKDAPILYPAIAVNVHVAAELERLDEADRLLDELLSPAVLRFPSSLSFLSPGYVVPLAIAARARGRADDLLARLERLGPSPWRDAASAVLHGDSVAAADVLESVGVLPEEALARLAAAEAFAAGGDKTAAEAQLDRCLPFFDHAGATAYSQRGRRLLSSSSPETTIAGYRIEREIGRGGMGVVYRATDPTLERPVALKLIAPEFASSEGFRTRFVRESKLAASLGHPHVLPIYAAGETDGRLYLVMRHVEGSDLKTLLAREGRLPPERALGICGQVAEALDAAHAKGLLHRDVKPANVLLDQQDEAYLADFGLSKQLTGDATQTGQLVGTLDYLPPEHIRGEELDGRTDEYALACLLYECLSGTPPFRRPTEAEVLWAHMRDQPPPLPEYPALDPVFERALAKPKEGRYSTCRALVVAARTALGLVPQQ
jgi:tetratricopeptide (TPR) repeat protein